MARNQRSQKSKSEIVTSISPNQNSSVEAEIVPSMKGVLPYGEQAPNVKSQKVAVKVGISIYRPFKIVFSILSLLLMTYFNGLNWVLKLLCCF